MLVNMLYAIYVDSKSAQLHTDEVPTRASSVMRPVAACTAGMPDNNHFGSTA